MEKMSTRLKGRLYICAALKGRERIKHETEEPKLSMRRYDAEPGRQQTLNVFLSSVSNLMTFQAAAINVFDTNTDSDVEGSLPKFMQWLHCCPLLVIVFKFRFNHKRSHFVK